MFLILPIIAVVVALVVLLIKYFCSYARLTSHDAFNREARNRTKELGYTDPKITCDFCGAQIDTLKDKICPICGGAYSQDVEWMKRYNTDRNWVDRNADEVADEQISLATQKAKKTAKYIRICIYILGGVLAALVILLILFYITEDESLPIARSLSAQKSEKLNAGSYEDYELQDYNIVGDNKIIYIDEMTVSIEGFYLDNGDYRKDNYIKVKLKIENKTKKPLRLKLERILVNRRNETSGGLYFYEWISGGDEITVYDTVRHCHESEISSISYGKMYVSAEEYAGTYIYENKGRVDFVTDSKVKPDENYPSGTEIYNNEGIRIIRIDPKDEYDTGTRLAVINDTDVDFTVDSRNGKIDGEAVDNYTLYNEVLPAHSMIISSDTVSASTIGLNESIHYELSLSFKSEDYPEEDFSTGYITILDNSQ